MSMGTDAPVRRPFEPDPDHAGVGNGICSYKQNHIPRQNSVHEGWIYDAGRYCRRIARLYCGGRGG